MVERKVSQLEDRGFATLCFVLKDSTFKETFKESLKEVREQHVPYAFIYNKRAF